LDNEYLIEGGDRFGVDTTDVVAQCILDGIQVNNITQFDYHFALAIGYIPPILLIRYTLAELQAFHRSAQLIETNFRVINE